MRQSKLFTRTRKEAPKDEVSRNAQLLIRAGYIHKEMAGVYSYLPLGLRVLKNIERIIREEMDAIGGQEIELTALQDKSLWEKTGRWDDERVDNWFKATLKNGSEVGLGITHEEPLTNIMTEYVSSYRDLPIYAYQFQTKFRNEARAKSGIMRGREFLMKDLYSFSLDEVQHKDFYEKAKEAYKKIFSRVGIGDLTYVTFAGGGIFSKFSEEFQTMSAVGEDTIYVDEKTGKAVNKEVLNNETLAELGIKRDDLVEKKSIEVGNIFHLGTKFSDALGLSYLDKEGNKKQVVMGSYGLGPSRLMGTIVEVLADDAGIVWPESVAPFKVHLIALEGGKGENNKKGESTVKSENPVKNYADNLYKKLVDAGVEVLYDDRDMRAGEKFADSDLIGIPYRVVVSEKTLAENKVEYKRRTGGGAGKDSAAEKIDEKELFRKIL